MNLFFKLFVSASILTVISGCAQTPSGSENSTATANVDNSSPVTASPVPSTPIPSSSPSPEPSVPVAAVAQPVTLPVLDAFFSDPDFAVDLKNKLGLNDDQISRLRTAAREQTAKLREDGPAEKTGSTAEAKQLADQEVKRIVGDEKAGQLYGLIQERWGGTPPASSAAQQPNSIPTDTRILVNIPAYRMDLFQNGSLVKTYRIGIGYPEFPLPTGMRKADTVIFNPTWTPPDEPWVEVSNKVKPGQKVAAGDKLNPLGPAKIPIGLPSLIHGGKAPAKIGGFASHGCVGLTTPQLNEFIPLLSNLAGSQITEADVLENELDKTKTKNVKLGQPVTVELRYETIVVQDGALHILRDVYDKDTNTDENLRAVLEVYGVTPDQLSDVERAKVKSALTAMSRDANGKLNDDVTDADKSLAAKTSKAKNTSAAITHSVKGAKEVVIEIASLKGKGYPDPVQMNTGSASAKSEKSSKRAAAK